MCVDEELVCDGMDDCEDGSDENRCGKLYYWFSSKSPWIYTLFDAYKLKAKIIYNIFRLISSEGNIMEGIW